MHINLMNNLQYHSIQIHTSIIQPIQSTKYNLKLEWEIFQYGIYLLFQQDLSSKEFRNAKNWIVQIEQSPQFTFVPSNLKLSKNHRIIYLAPSMLKKSFFKKKYLIYGC
ncbi:unnamed protein product [Paramecium octaurelia]|uniref:Uncharacterized protein n=1 Tax=Paramecium octaurelia TaxID=43137 RepID=A0A8S1VRM9_PAROT|nr:unnamed protein product [Paramecium octaurelia]